MSNLLKHAKREFILAGWIDKETGEYCDEMQEMLCKQVIELLEVFGGHGHSGFSAPHAIQMFTTLAKFNTITKLTGEDDEWMEIAEDAYRRSYQNIRDSEVFKTTDLEGNVIRTYWIHGKVFKDPDGSMYTNTHSCVDITFPWGKPEKSEIVEVSK